ncbi:hypothetical protein C8A05DRAFT_34105 [Staphylotrichum tortipilum]|uniref:Uncharacterized protein n=1 Tax=Staphylotrichum tortipilum TaxID=2831512 RepID=A0AAN6MLS2_9PEZI|nr:hypothetical protein C8A05DRAFT_34105 [Staphylotrichum longicolle]
MSILLRKLADASLRRNYQPQQQSQRKLADPSVRRNYQAQQQPQQQSLEAALRAYKSPWAPGAWQRAQDALANGTRPPPPPPRFPIVLAPDSPISSAAALQADGG